MDVRKLKNKFIEANIVTDDIKVMFRLPDCKSYDDCNCHIENINGNNVLVVDLLDKIEPIFKVGDIVTNSSGLYPNVKCTITTVDKEKQCYYFKEVAGVTYFKDQDKLMCVNNIEPKFKSGDKVKGASSENPEKVFVINIVNTGHKCYHYFNGNGIVTMFKDQDKLTLVNDEEVQPPVEGDIKLSLDATIARQNVQIYNHNTYEQFALIDKFIDKRSKTGYNSYTATLSTTVFHHDKTGKILVLSDLVDRIVNHYTNLGFTVNTDKDDNNYKILIEW